MKKQSLFVLAVVVTVLVVLPISVRGDSLMHVGIGRGMRTGPDKAIDIGRGPCRSYYRWGRYRGESLMHVGIGRGMRTGSTKGIDIGRGPCRGYYRWGHYKWGYYRGESLMHVGIGRGMRTGSTKDIDIGRGSRRSYGYKRGYCREVLIIHVSH